MSTILGTTLSDIPVLYLQPIQGECKRWLEMVRDIAVSNYACYKKRDMRWLCDSKFCSSTHAHSQVCLFLFINKILFATDIINRSIISDTH